MQRINNKIVASLLFLLSYLPGLSAPKDTIHVSLSIRNKEASKTSDLNISVIIDANTKDSVRLPREMVWGYFPAYQGFLEMQVQKKTGTVYYNLKNGIDRIDNYPVSTFDTLTTGHPLTFDFDAGGLYIYEKGEYRIRVLCRLSLLNPHKDIYSNWIYFSCKNTLILSKN